MSILDDNHTSYKAHHMNAIGTWHGESKAPHGHRIAEGLQDGLRLKDALLDLCLRNIKMSCVWQFCLSFLDKQQKKKQTSKRTNKQRI